MNESTVSSKFQTKLREALPGCVVVKHADKSMIGMVDASFTINKLTLWCEYKFIGPVTKGVMGSEFMQTGEWSPEVIAAASPTQFATAKRLATSGHCIYLFWVMDHQALRKRVAYVTLWHPITGKRYDMKPTKVVAWVVDYLNGVRSLELLETHEPA